MKNAPKLPAWMRSGRPDAIVKNCLNVQDGLVEATDFDPAMCQECENTTCKWHPSKLARGGQVEDLDEEEEEDDEADDVESDEDSDHESGADPDDDADER